MQFLKHFNVQGRQIHPVFDTEVRVSEGMVATLMTTWVTSKHLRKQQFATKASEVYNCRTRSYTASKIARSYAGGQVTELVE